METIKHCGDTHCLTCSDEMLSVSVVSLCEDADIALVEVGGQREEIDISLVEQVKPGDMLLVHGGVALARQMTGSASNSVEETT